MNLPTLANILDKVNNDLDLTDEVMISRDEKVAYVNAAVDEVEQILLPLYEDYFLQKADLALVLGESEYDFPSNIYAHKIRKVFYDNGTDRYEIRRIRNLSEVPDVDVADAYRYVVLTNSTGQHKMQFYPASREDSADNVEIWFLGSANDLSDDADIMNVPEAFNLVVAKTKLMCAMKESHPSQVALETDVEKQETRFLQVIAAMVPDEDNQLLVTSRYGDSEGYY